MSALADRACPSAARTGNEPQGRMVSLSPGADYVTARRDELIVTVLGSCVAACVRDPATGIGGMNHFMLPHDEEGVWGGASRALRFGNHAMESLINTLLKAGAARMRLEIKLFGGANVMSGMNAIGEQNADFARAYVKREGFALAAADLGGVRGRRVVFQPSTGRAWRRFLAPTAAQAAIELEMRLRTEAAQRAAGAVDLFERGA